MSDWSSLEVVKLAVAALTPILLFILGLVVSRAARRVEEAQWANRKLIERRLELYEDLAPKLNDLFCFFLLVGHFKEITPSDALARKRELDRTFHAHAPLFSRDFADRYRAFMAACFKSFTGVGEPTKLRASPAWQRAQRRGTPWLDEWDRMFVGDEGEESFKRIESAYDALMDAFAAEVGARAGERRTRVWLMEERLGRQADAEGGAEAKP